MRVLRPRRVGDGRPDGRPLYGPSRRRGPHPATVPLWPYGGGLGEPLRDTLSALTRTSANVVTAVPNSGSAARAAAGSPMVAVVNTARGRTSTAKVSLTRATSRSAGATSDRPVGRGQSENLCPLRRQPVPE